MEDEIESAEDIRSRIRNEARQRRTQQFLLRRAARELPPSGSKNRNIRSHSSSRSSSPDLLASPPPSRAAERVVLQKEEVSAPDCLLHKDENASAMLTKANIPKPSPSSEYDQCKNHSIQKESPVAIKPKFKRKKFYESSSSEEEDEEEIARRIALRKASKQTGVASKTSKFNVDSESDSSTDFVARRRLAKKKNGGTCHVNGAKNTSICQSEECEDFTQKISNVSPSKSCFMVTKSNDTNQMSSSDIKADVLGGSDDGLHTQKEISIGDNALKDVNTDLVVCDSERKHSPPSGPASDPTKHAMQSTLTQNNRSSISDNMLDQAERKLTSINETVPINEQIAIDLTDDSPVKETISSGVEVQRNAPVISMNTSSTKTSQMKQSTRQPSSQRTLELSGRACSSSLTESTKSLRTSDVSDENIPDPIIAEHITTPSNVHWSVHKQCLIVRTVQGTASDKAPRTKVAGFDLDDTLVIWRCSGWPSRAEHYELWSGSVVSRMQKLHDEGYKLVIFSNQGGIRGAFQGKNASRIRSLIDWIANLVGRPLFAICSTKKDGGYHKGNAGMWSVMEEICNGGVKAKPELSFFVGDADGAGENARDEKQQQYQVEGVDKLFAQNVGKLRNVTMEFFNPIEFFGRSNADKRKVVATIGPPLQLSKEVMTTRAALLGGYLSRPLLLVLVGVQGSGKTTFCQGLTEGTSDWCHYSQDTISDGKPGKREAVEAAAITSLKEGKNVVIDRMHLDADQRGHFLKLGKQCNVSVHCLVMIASKEEVKERVTNRTNHPGKVEGVRGARIAAASLDRLKMPSYDEGFDLISYSYEIDGLLLTAYRRLSNVSCCTSCNELRNIKLYNSGMVSLPMVTLGTMKLSKKTTRDAVSRAIQLGIVSIDTAPTYENEDQVGLALATNPSVKVTIKVPKRVLTPAEARNEVQNTMKALGLSCADIALLHWPCDLIEAGSLQSVWKELESMKAEGICKTIGVSNFSISSLMQLLSICQQKPAINQVERHPLLPQYDLLEYCHSQGIVVQAHTALGHANRRLMENDAILRVSSDIGLTAAQVLLLWNVQQGVPVVTKFSSEKHGQDVVPILQSKIKLSPQHMKIINEIGLSDETGTRFVAPPFMYKSGAIYSWGDDPPPT